MKTLRILLIAAVPLAVAACAMAPLPPPQASIDSLQAIRASNIVPVSVGQFTLGPGLSPKNDKSIGIRAMTVAAPGGSFTAYLRDTLTVELRAAGKLDATSSVVVSGTLTTSRIDSGMSGPNAELGATFVVMRDGKEVYRKPLTVAAQWTGDFIGGVAIPEAERQYTGLYSKLVRALLTDSEFKAAAGLR